jgi:hypothetical protein
VLGSPDKPGLDRIAFHVPAHGEELLVAHDRNHVKAPLVDVAFADGAVADAEVLSVLLREPADEAGQIRGADRAQDQVPVVRHEAVRVQAHVDFGSARRHQAFEAVVLRWVAEEWSAVVAAVHDVVERSGDDPARDSGHDNEDGVERRKASRRLG